MHVAIILDKHQNAEQMLASDGRRKVTPYVTSKPLHEYIAEGLPKRF